MVIRRMISRDVEAFREFQTRTVEVGRIRTGQFVTPEGKKGRPVKLDRFRLTSATEAHIRAAADEYGGEARPYQPQGGGARQWEVVTERGALDVFIINGQFIDPVYEMWGAGRTCVRRCDGEWNAQTREPCLCNGPNRPSDPRQLCKVTTRVQVMLPSVAGLHAWRLETHSENAAVEMGAPAVSGLVQVARVPVPATLYLRKEQRRERDHEQEKFVTKDFYVPTFHIPLSALALAAGPEAVTAALTAAGAPAVLAAPEDRRAIEAARPVSAPVYDLAGPPSTEVADDPQGGALLPAKVHAEILQAIEGKTTIAELDATRERMIAENIRYKAIQDAWVSKRAALMQQAAMRAARMAEEDPEGFAVALDAMSPEDREELRRRMAARDDRRVFEQAARDEPEGRPRPSAATQPGEPGYQELVDESEAFSEPGFANAGWTSTDGEPTVFEDAERGREYAVGDTVTVGGMEFTKISDYPFLPAGDYTVAAEWPLLMTLAGKFDPPLTTDQVRRRVNAAFGLGHVGEATGEQLARVRAALAAELEKADVRA